MRLVPMGIIPERIWKLRRYADLQEAINRYVDADLYIPSAWLKEASKLERELKL